HAGLGREMHDPVEAFGGEKLRDAFAIGEIELDELEPRVRLEQCQARALQLGVVVLVQIIEADDLVSALEQPLRGVESDEPGGPGDQYLQRALPSLTERSSRLEYTAAPSARRRRMDASNEGSAFRRGAATAEDAGGRLQPRVHLLFRQHGFDVIEHVIRRAESSQPGRSELDELAVRDGEHDRIV